METQKHWRWRCDSCNSEGDFAIQYCCPECDNAALVIHQVLEKRITNLEEVVKSWVKFMAGVDID